MLAEELPVAWRVRVSTPSGVVHAERIFSLWKSPKAQEDAEVYANLMGFTCPFCRVEIAPLTPEQS